MKSIETPELLTRREDQVLKALAEGLTNKEIAKQLGISYETAKEHVQNILRKLGVSDRTQAAIWLVSQRPQAETRRRLMIARESHLAAVQCIDKSLAVLSASNGSASKR